MANEEVSSTRRNLLIATGVVGAMGVAGASVPFISSFQPSARAKTAGAPVDVDISKIDNEPGMRMIVQWRGKPVWIFKRTKEQLAALPGLDGKLRDPKSDNIDQTPAFAKNEARTIAGKENIAVIVGVCTHLGCSPTPKFRKGIESGIDEDWEGGFYCPCHSSTYDLAGRVFKDKLAPTNLEVPPYRFIGDGKLIIGEETKKA